MAAGIDGGITTEVVFGCLVFTMFERIRTLNSPAQSVQSRRLPTGYFGIAVGIVAA
jgi:hypothetical protein